MFSRNGFKNSSTTNLLQYDRINFLFILTPTPITVSIRISVISVAKKTRNRNTLSFRHDTVASLLSNTPAATAEPMTPATLGPIACSRR